MMGLTMQRWLWGAIIGLSLGTVPAQAGVVTSVPLVKIDSGAIRLGDIFHGLSPAQDTEIAVAPAPGRSVTYDYSVLGKVAQRYNLDWQAGSFTDKTVITRAAHKIDTDMIKAALTAQLRNRGITGDIDIALDNRALELNLPTDVKAEFSLSDFSYDPANQRFRTELLAAIDTPAFQQVTVTGRAVAAVAVPVLNRVLPQGATIGKADLDWIKMPSDHANDYMRTAETIVGMELRRQMPEQSPLRVQDVTAARVVKRGALVTMKIMHPAMMLTAQGRALQDGAVGEVIRVANTHSNRAVDARVVAAGEVQIDMFPNKIASVE